MESGNGASSSTGHFLPVPMSSDDFLNGILAPLQSAHLFEESKHSFKYTAAFSIKNSALEEKYIACREKRREQGYIDEDLKETYGFLLFDELGKAKSIGETGVLTGNGTCTTLGDPTKGVYLSMYSDCLDLNRWYHGKSGYIAILRLTQGRVKRVSENYTQNLTEPTEGFDCHVSEQLPSVSSKTSSFLAFERTQYYFYELLDNGSTAQSPSLACPYAIVAFSYDDTKETQQEKSEETKVGTSTKTCPYSPWMGTLQIGSQMFDIEIKSTTGALTRAKLPQVIKAERAISMLNLRKLLPKAIFDTTLNGKAPENDLDCSLCEIVALSSKEKEKLTPLLLEIKEKDAALIITLSDEGFLVLIHGSHFIFHDNDNGMATNKVLQGVFVFPRSQAIQRVTKIDQKKRRLPLDALRVLPLLTYAEGEIQKTGVNTNEDLCEIFVHYMQSYATLISPGHPSSPFREVSIFPDQYDVPDTHGHLYSTPEWTDNQWQSLKLYLNNANSFQLPVCKASEIFAAGQEVQRADLEDDIYICLSSPEEPSTTLISTGSEDRPDQECSTNVEMPQDTTQPVSTLSQMVPNVQTREAVSETANAMPSIEKDNKCIETSELTVRTELPEELIVCITSAAQTVGEEGLDRIKHDQLLVTAELQTATLKSLSEIVQSKVTLNRSDDCNLETDSDMLPLGQNLESTKSPDLQMVKTLQGKDESFCMDHVTTQELEKQATTPETQGNKQELEKHATTSEIQGNKQENDTSSKPTQVLEQADSNLADNAFLKELETWALRKKSERWGLKPVTSTCGRIFIPYGSVDNEQIKSLQEKLRLTKDKMHPEEKNADALSEVSNASKNKQETGDDKEATKPTEELCHKKCVGHKNVDKSVLTSNTEHLLEGHKENHIKDISIAEKLKGEEMLKGLKSVILRKRNTDILRIGLNVNDNLDNEPSPKRSKTDLTLEKSNSDICAKDTNEDIQNLTNLPSVDPIFAHALGLTPTGTLDIDCVQRSDLPMDKEIAKEYPSSKQQTQSSPKGLGPRLKMLKKSQSISTEQVKKKWWLHFQTPACYAEKQYEGSSRDISVRMTVKEKKDTSSEALNLLADLALSANKEQISPHPIQACVQEFGSNLKKCEITKDVSNPEQQSVLHALLRHPASKPIQPHETSSPDSFEGSKLVDVICQEHAYSLPSSPSLLLALPAPFQVSPLNGSSRLLHTQRLWEGAETMPSFFSPEDEAESIRRDPGDPKRSWYERKFCLTRTIVNKEKSVQVTRQWEGLYDFSLDSRFTVDPKDKTIVRALHGPWDFSICDTTEELQLIVHMWIGLFYSRSTARFFHLDPDMPLASSEDAVLDTVDTSVEKEYAQSVSETVLHYSLPNAEDKLEPKILDLSKPKSSVVDKEPVALNLSQRPSNAESENQNPELKEKTEAQALNTLNPQELQAALPFQCYWNLIHTGGNSTQLTYVGVPVKENNGYSSELNRQLFIPVWGGTPNTNMWTNNVPTPVLPTAESNDHQSENAPVHFPKHPESPIKKRATRKVIPKKLYLSSVQHRNESRENKDMQQVKENLPDMNMVTGLNPGNVDVDMMTSNHLLEIKKTYLEKLASLNQQRNIPTYQNDKEVRHCDLLKQLLQEDINRDTPKPQKISDCKSIPGQTPLLNTSLCQKNSQFNQRFVGRQHVFSFPKAFTTSVVTETCTENRSEQKSLNIVDLAPLVEENSKCSSIVDSVGVSSLKEKDEPAGQCMAMSCPSEYPNQDMNIRNQNTVVENAMDCSWSQDENLKTVEASLINKTNVNTSSTNEAENNYRGFTIPLIGMNTSIEDMFKENISSEVEEENTVEDMEIVTSDSSPAHSEVTAPLPIYADSTSDNCPRNQTEKSVAESEMNNPFAVGDGEADDRCPTPTIDEQPFVYMRNDSGNDLEKVSLNGAEKEAALITAHCDATTKAAAQSDVELRTLRTLQCLDEFLATLKYKSNQLLQNSEHTHDIYDFRDMKTPPSMSESCPTESTQYLLVSPSSNVLGDMQQLKASCTSLLNVPGMLPQVASNSVSSAEKPDQAIISENEKPKLDTSSCSISQCPDDAERPSEMCKRQTIPIKQKGHLDVDACCKPIKFSIKRTKRGNFVCSGPVFDSHNETCADTVDPCNHARPVQQDVQNLQCTEAVSTMSTQTIDSGKSTSKHVTVHDTHPRDKTGIVKTAPTGEDLLNSTTSFVNCKTNKITDNILGTEGSLSCTVTNNKRQGSTFLEKVSQRCLQDNPTQSSMDRECLIFIDKMKLLLKTKNQCLQVHDDQSNLLSSSPIIVQFSHLKEQDDVFGDIQIPFSFFDQKISVDMSNREQLRDVAQQSSSKSLPHEDLEQPRVSAIKAECARLYRDIMDKICSGNRNTSLLKDLHKTDSGDLMSDSCNYFDFCSQMKREMDDNFHSRLNLVVKKSCKTKNRFFLFVTSGDVFFNKTRGYLEAEGHISVQPSEFFLKESSGSSPLLVIIRNEDIAEHIFKVPHLLQLRKSPVVQFAGIDEPDDVVNLTYQEVFIKGGFVMFDSGAVESLSPGNMRKVLEILQRLIQTGKWKWVLHYRDSRRLKENARLCSGAKEKTDLLNKCKEDGLLDILPYHECDLMSREEPNYLQCLCRQQVQNISARYPVFVSDSETNRGFEKNGILTMTVNSFLLDSLSKIIKGLT